MSANLINVIELAKNSNQQSNEIKVYNAIASSRETPLKLGGLTIDCYVLDDKNGTPVLSKSGIYQALGISKGGGKIEKLIHDKLKSVISGHAVRNTPGEDIENPIVFKFRNPYGCESTAYGYKATFLIDICNWVILARDKGINISDNTYACAKAIVLAAAKTGITAMVYEATGYEKIKARDAYTRFFNSVLFDEAKKWEKFFDDDGILHDLAVMKKVDWARPGRYPLYFGKLINDLVYSRIAPNMMLELQNRNPKINDHRRYRHHQFFQNNGDKIAKEHLDKLHLLAKASGYNWELFMAMVNNALPVQPQTDIDEYGNIIEDAEEE